MRKVSKILENCAVLETIARNNQLEGKLCFDSGKVENGDMFVAVRGSSADGHDYIDQAVEHGAKYIICEKLPVKLMEDVSYFRLENTKLALGLIASAYYDNPSKKLKIVGITGTNGKTTIASLLYDLTHDLGYVAGLISTIRIRINGKDYPASHTTPDPVQLQSSLNEMVKAGCEYVFMEVSSHAIDQDRIAGLNFVGGIFTNLTHDHLDYHHDFASYRDAKKKFFDHLPSDSFALINKDDKNGRIMVQNTKANVHEYSLKSESEFKIYLKEMHLEGNLLMFRGEELWTNLTGQFNAYNSMAVIGTALLLGFDKSEILKAFSLQSPAEGRFEVFISKKGTTVIVDYAHTPDALENVLNTIKEISGTGRRIISIVGAGGDRDKTKRPEMAKIAALLSDRVILTSDNPRSEDPAEIIEDMEAGLDVELNKKVASIIDRDEAIKITCALAEPQDIILLAGKGHETYQEIMGIKHPFDDRQKIKKYLSI